MDREKYIEVVEKLKEPFPPGTVKKRNDNDRFYIPYQVYLDRLERVLSGEWSMEIRELNINIEQKYVTATVRVIIDHIFRDGSVYTPITAQGVDNAVERAKSAALVDALDTWQMGWRDLLPYNNDLGTNPGLAHLVTSVPPETGMSSPPPHSKIDRKCIGPGCGKFLTQEEYEVLKRIPSFNVQKMVYCCDHIPEAFFRKLEPVADKLPPQYQQRLEAVLAKKRR